MSTLHSFLPRRPVQLVLSTAAALTVVGLLTAAIYWTGFDPRWGIFLGGVLFAAVLALASGASRAEWIVARRTRQLERMRQRLKEADARSTRATEAFKAVELRTRALADALTQPVILCDRNQECCFHNSAAALEGGGSLAGKSLREIFGDAHEAMLPQIEASLAGEPATCELSWDGAGSGSSYVARLLPHPPGAASPEGLWVILDPATAAQRTGHEAMAGKESGESIYLSAIAQELTGWDDPRAKIARALAEDRFVLYQQKIAPLELGQADPLCHEILLRMQDEEDNHLPPGGFLLDAERFGLMADIDRWVVRHLVGWCLEQQRRDCAWQVPLYCVNLSTAALRDASFGHYVQKQLQRGLSGRTLCFEIGEADLVALPGEIRRLVAMLKPFGVRFTVDAFGSVKGSFAPLQGLEFDFLKIDGVIVQNIRRDASQMARVRAIAAACRKVGLRTIGELVEDDETLSLLRGAGVDYAQGFGIVRPAQLPAQSRVARLKIA